MTTPVAQVKGVFRNQYPYIDTTTPKARTPLVVNVKSNFNSHVKSR